MDRMEPNLEEQGQLEESAVEALHQTMVVLREELDQKNQVIRKLRKKIRNPRPNQISSVANHGCIVTIEDCDLNLRNYDEFQSMVEDVLSNKLAVKSNKRTREEDSMYGDGDSETESDSNITNNNLEHEEVDVLEVFMRKEGNKANEKYKKEGKEDEQCNKAAINTSKEAKGQEIEYNEEDEEYDNEIENILNDVQTSPSKDKGLKPKLENQFSDDFVDIFNVDESEVTKGEQEEDKMNNSLDGSSTSSEDGRQRVYKVNLMEDDINISICEEISDNDDDLSEETERGEDIFFSSEDVMMNFVDLDNSKKIISVDEDPKNIGNITNDKTCDKTYEVSEEEQKNIALIDNVERDSQLGEHLQVEKHLLKFELSKQLFESKPNKEENKADDILPESPEEQENKNLKETVPFYTQLHTEIQPKKSKMNEDLFASLFDYELQQVEEIKAGLSVLSNTLTKSNLLKLEQELFMKRSFSFNDVFPPKSSQVLIRSTSEPTFETIAEDENNPQENLSESGSDMAISPIRPILKKKAAVSLSCHGSQTDISAVEAGSKIINLGGKHSSGLDRYSSDPGLAKQTQQLTKRSQSVSFLLPPSEYTISKLLQSRESLSPDPRTISPQSNPFSLQSTLTVDPGRFNDKIPIPEKSRFENAQMNKDSTSKSYNNLSFKNHMNGPKSTIEIPPSQEKSPVLNPETLLGDISFLNQFKAKMITKENDTIITKEVGGRYSLLDRDLKTVDTASHVITELWKLPAEKSLNCLMGQMESCEDEIVIGDEQDGSRRFSTQPFPIKPLVKADYRDFLVPKTNTEKTYGDSEGDTDDLIEDARNFVKASQIKIVDNEDWKEIDEKRRKRRLTRKERNEKRESGRFGSDGEENKKDLNGGTTCEPFLPRRISDLKVGYLVRVISAAGSKVSPGIVRFLGYVDGEEKVGIELKENLGDCDGTFRGKFYFKCSPGYGQFVGLSRVVLAWRTK